MRVIPSGDLYLLRPTHAAISLARSVTPLNLGFDARVTRRPEEDDEDAFENCAIRTTILSNLCRRGRLLLIVVAHIFVNCESAVLLAIVFHTSLDV